MWSSIALLRPFTITILRRGRSIQERGHDVHRSIDNIHNAILQRVVHVPPAAAPKLPKHGNKIAEPSRDNSGQSGKRNGTTDRGEHEVHGRCLALRDYYPFWRENLEAAGAGKLLPVDLSENPKVSASWKLVSLIAANTTVNGFGVGEMFFLWLFCFTAPCCLRMVGPVSATCLSPQRLISNGFLSTAFVNNSQ